MVYIFSSFDKHSWFIEGFQCFGWKQSYTKMLRRTKRIAETEANLARTWLSIYNAFDAAYKENTMNACSMEEHIVSFIWFIHDGGLELDHNDKIHYVCQIIEYLILHQNLKFQTFVKEVYVRILSCYATLLDSLNNNIALIDDTDHQNDIICWRFVHNKDFDKRIRLMEKKYLSVAHTHHPLVFR